MRTLAKFSMIIIFVTCVFSCANREQVCDNIFRGIYDLSNQDQEMKRANDPSLPPEQKPPTYDQYKKERQKILEKQDETAEQQQ